MLLWFINSDIKRKIAVCFKRRYKYILTGKHACWPVVLQGVSTNIEQIGNRSQIFKAADGMKFLVQTDYFGTYDVK